MSLTIDKNTMLSMLELREPYTLSQLTAAYKRAVGKHKCDNVEDPMFKMLSVFYTKLRPDAIGERASVGVRASTPMARPTTAPPSTHRAVPKDSSRGDNRFDIRAFNQLFEKHKIKEVHEDGYEGWIKDEESFKERSRHDVGGDDEPAPIVSGADDLACYELGVRRVGDHSGQNLGALHFSDYRLAHTTERVVDPSRVKARREYKSVQDLEADRSRIAFTMSEREEAEYKRKQEEAARREDARLRALKERDALMDRLAARAERDFSRLR